MAMNRDTIMKSKILFILMTVLLSVWAFDVPLSFGTVKPVKQWKQYTGKSSDTKPTLSDRDAGSEFIELNTGRHYLWDSDSWELQKSSAYAVGDSTGASLSATGETAAIYVRGFTIAGFFFEITKINTNATIGLQSKVGTSGWTNHDIDPTTYTANGNEGLVSSSIADVDSIRLNFSAETGGTDAIITNIVPTRGTQ